MTDLVQDPSYSLLSRMFYKPSDLAMITFITSLVPA
jgi:hypothetical protein